MMHNRFVNLEDESLYFDPTPKSIFKRISIISNNEENSLLHESDNEYSKPNFIHDTSIE